MEQTIDTLVEDGWEVGCKEHKGKNLWTIYKKEGNEMKLYDPITDETKLPLLQANFRVDLRFRDDSTGKTREDVERLMMYENEDSNGLPWVPEEIKGTFNETMQAFYDRGNKVKGVDSRVIEGTDIDITLSVTGVEYGWFSDKLYDRELQTITLDKYIQLGMPDVIKEGALERGE